MILSIVWEKIKSWFIKGKGWIWLVGAVVAGIVLVLLKKHPSLGDYLKKKRLWDKEESDAIKSIDKQESDRLHERDDVLTEEQRAAAEKHESNLKSIDESSGDLERELNDKDLQDLADELKKKFGLGG